MYMSYCRYEGTLQELRACIADVEDHVNQEAEWPVRDREVEAFRNLVHEMHEFMVNVEILDSYGDIDEESLDCVCKLMKEGSHGDD